MESRTRRAQAAPPHPSNPLRAVMRFAGRRIPARRARGLGIVVVPVPFGPGLVASSERFRPSREVSHPDTFAGRIIRRQLLPARCCSLRCRLKPRYMLLLCSRLTPPSPPASLPMRERLTQGQTQDKEVSPDKNTNCSGSLRARSCRKLGTIASHHGGMPSTLRPKPEGFAAWCPLAPSARPNMAFLFIAPRLCLGLPSHQASRLASRYCLIIAFGSIRSCHRLMLFITYFQC